MSAPASQSTTGRGRRVQNQADPAEEQPSSGSYRITRSRAGGRSKPEPQDEPSTDTKMPTARKKRTTVATKQDSAKLASTEELTKSGEDVPASQPATGRRRRVVKPESEATEEKPTPAETVTGRKKRTTVAAQEDSAKPASVEEATKDLTTRRRAGARSKAEPSTGPQTVTGRKKRTTTVAAQEDTAKQTSAEEATTEEESLPASKPDTGRRGRAKKQPTPAEEQPKSPEEPPKSEGKLPTRSRAGARSKPKPQEEPSTEAETVTGRKKSSRAATQKDSAIPPSVEEATTSGESLPATKSTTGRRGRAKAQPTPAEEQPVTEKVSSTRSRAGARSKPEPQQEPSAETERAVGRRKRPRAADQQDSSAEDATTGGESLPPEEKPATKSILSTRSRAGGRSKPQPPEEPAPETERASGRRKRARFDEEQESAKPAPAEEASAEDESLPASKPTTGRRGRAKIEPKSTEEQSKSGSILSTRSRAGARSKQALQEEPSTEAETVTVAGRKKRARFADQQDAETPMSAEEETKGEENVPVSQPDKEQQVSVEMQPTPVEEKPCPEPTLKASSQAEDQIKPQPQEEPSTEAEAMAGRRKRPRAADNQDLTPTPAVEATAPDVNLAASQPSSEIPDAVKIPTSAEEQPPTDSIVYTSSRPENNLKPEPREEPSSEAETMAARTKRPRLAYLEVPTRPILAGEAMTCGENNCGQLGYHYAERRRPTIIKGIPDPVVQVACGALHTLCLTEKGVIYSFGCNDEGTLGRPTLDPDQQNGSIDDTLDIEPENKPGRIDLEKVVRISAGDSHSACINEDGDVFIWGTFRSDQGGALGLLPDSVGKVASPIKLDLGAQKIVDIASGGDHLLLLNQDGEVLSLGIPEQGQLGRLPQEETNIDKENRHKFLSPCIVDLGGPCDRIWAGHFSSFARRSSGEIYAWGLNRSSQLGFPCKDIIVCFPVPIAGLPNEPQNKIELMSAGVEHTLALDTNGSIYSFGSSHYGRLGYKLHVIKQNGDSHGDESSNMLSQGSSTSMTVKPELTDQQTPRMIPNLPEKMIKIWTRSSQSFAIGISGEIYIWGMASMHQGISMPDQEQDDIWEPRKMNAKSLTGKIVLDMSSGTEHLALIATLANQSSGAIQPSLPAVLDVSSAAGNLGSNSIPTNPTLAITQPALAPASELMSNTGPLASNATLPKTLSPLEVTQPPLPPKSEMLSVAEHSALDGTSIISTSVTSEATQPPSAPNLDVPPQTENKEHNAASADPSSGATQHPLPPVSDKLSGTGPLVLDITSPNSSSPSTEATQPPLSSESDMSSGTEHVALISTLANSSSEPTQPQLPPVTNGSI